LSARLCGRRVRVHTICSACRHDGAAALDKRCIEAARGAGGAAAQTKPYNLRETKVIRDLMPEDINQLVSVSGMVTRCSSVIPEMQCAPRRPRP